MYRFVYVNQLEWFFIIVEVLINFFFFDVKICLNCKSKIFQFLFQNVWENEVCLRIRRIEGFFGNMFLDFLNIFVFGGCLNFFFIKLDLFKKYVIFY